MKYVYITLIVLAVILVVILLYFLIRHLRIRFIIKKVKCCSLKEKIEEINCLLEPFGFQYDCSQDIFTTLENPWQREMGYCRLYDEEAATLNMVFDCEPIKFKYKGEDWLIELWKGQYGITTGGEIGVYKARKDMLIVPRVFTGTFYESVSEAEMLPLEFVLEKCDKCIIKCKGVTWWLTGFVLGEWSRPRDLVMKASVTFPDMEMRNAFLESLYELGYKRKEVCVCNLRVTVIFSCPKSKQPRKRCKLKTWIVQRKNKRNCRLYQDLTECFCKTVDKVYFLLCVSKKMFRLIFCISRLNPKKKWVCKIRKYIGEGKHDCKGDDCCQKHEKNCHKKKDGEDEW